MNLSVVVLRGVRFDLSEFYMHPDEDNETSDDQEEADNNDNQKHDENDESVDIEYAAYAGGKWWPFVRNREDWAGKSDNEPITAVAIRVSRGSVRYRVHTVNGNWYSHVTGCDIEDIQNGFAGDLRNAIDALELTYYTPEGEEYKYAHYMVSPEGMRNFYPEQIDAEVRDGMDGYAGVFGRAIDKIQMWVE